MRSQPRLPSEKRKYVLSAAPRPAVGVDAGALGPQPVRVRELDELPGLRRRRLRGRDALPRYVPAKSTHGQSSTA